MALRFLRGRSRPRSAGRRLAVAVAVTATLAATGGSAVGDDFGDLPPQERYVTKGAVTSTQGAVVRRSKMYITIRPDNPIWGLLYYGEWNACGSGRRATICPIGKPVESYGSSIRIGWPFALPGTCTAGANPNANTQYVRSKLVVVSVRKRPTPSGTEYPADQIGQFPAVRVNMVAFGSIPVTATLRMSMRKRDGVTFPWTVHVWNPTGLVGCAQTPSTYYRALIEGQVDIRLSDLRVDGNPVDLGSSCRTSRPVDLALWGEPGYIALSGGLLSQRSGLETGSGTVVPLRTPGYPETNSSIYFEDEGRMLPDSTGVTIPPFTGCGTTEDLDPLVTAMASGPDNPVTVAQGYPLSDGFDLADLGRCSASGRCPLPAPEVPERPALD